MNRTIWLSRGLIALVAGWNLQAAAVLLLRTVDVASSLSLPGYVGLITIRGIAILFIMWNIPYLIAIINPIKHRISLYEALAMQAIGLVGEIILKLASPNLSAALAATINTYILFDFAGLILLIAAALIIRQAPFERNAPVRLT